MSGLYYMKNFLSLFLMFHNCSVSGWLFSESCGLSSWESHLCLYLFFRRAIVFFEITSGKEYQESEGRMLSPRRLFKLHYIFIDADFLLYFLCVWFEGFFGCLVVCFLFVFFSLKHK